MHDRVTPLPAHTMIEVLARRARDEPESLAYAAGTDTVTYGALHEQVRSFASGLASRGLSAGERCALLLPTGLDFVRAFYAVQALGAVPAAVNPGLPLETVRRRLRSIRAAFLIHGDCCGADRLAGDSSLTTVCSSDLRSSGGLVRFHDSGPESVAYLQFTSGTTGDSKAAVILHRNLWASFEGAIERLRISADDVFSSWVPLHHALGLVRFVLGPLYFGCRSHLVPSASSSLGSWLRTIRDVRATITGGPDSAYKLAARVVGGSGVDIASLRYATDGGEAVRAASIEEFERAFGLPRVVQPAYGLAEATLGVSSPDPGEPLRIGPGGALSCGRPFSGVEVRVVSEDGSSVPPLSDGEVVVRGEPVFAGYADDPDATAAVLREGWLHTGDVGCLDGDGNLYVKARARALIKRAGAVIVPREVEDAADGVRGVVFSAAVGLRRSSVTETEDLVVVAEVENGCPGGAAGIRSEIAARVTDAIGCAPTCVRIVPAGTIPRTASGKTRYDELRRLLESEG
ncbi:MAG: class I adenylate-forming enzyme family protein [Vicinamibacterales bacterium]